MSLSGDAWFVAEGLTKEFHGVVAVGDADLELRAGEVRGVVGPNGAGKSTLMQMIAGIHRPDGGRLLIDGSPVQLRGPEDAREHGIALVPQETLLAPHLSVAENIVLGGEPRRRGLVSASRSRAIATTALERLEAEIAPDRVVDELNPVERRLVMVARALIGETRLIILDEPTAALAPSEADTVLTMVRRLTARGVSFLYVTHRFDDIEALADTVTGVRDARVVADLRQSEITRSALVSLVDPGSRSVRNGRAGSSARAEVVLAAEDLSGGPVERLDLTVRAGEIVGLAGLAGSGADEAVAMMGAVAPWTRGTVTVDGHPVRRGQRRSAVRHGVAYVPGNRALATLPNHAVGANMSVVRWDSLATAGVARPRREQSLARELADEVDLRGDVDGPISDLSGGNQQKAIFARWTGPDLRVLLLHDPTAGVDIGARAQIHDQVRRLAATGVAVVVVSTDLPEVIDLADRIVVLDRGQVGAELVTTDLDEATLLAAMARSGPERPPTTSTTPSEKETTHA